MARRVLSYAAELGPSDRDPVRAAGSAERRTLGWETVLLLGVSLGASAIWSVLSIIEKLTRNVPLRSQTTAMNQSATPDRPWLDLAYQLAGVLIQVVPVALALYLLSTVLRPSTTIGAARFIGFDRTEPVRDLLRGLGLAALIGLPGLGFYFLAKAAGINTTVSAANLTDVWWSGPVLTLAAIGNALLEEVVMVGYLFSRWGSVGWGKWRIILTSALIRGSYHLYQGFGGFVGNLVMGIIFGWFYTRTKRVMPLVVAHTILDVVAFVGYALLKSRLGWL